jgi:hypothetical protein
MSNNTENSKQSCTAEVEVASEFPQLFAFLLAHPPIFPQSVDGWSRTLRVARNCQPLLADLYARGIDLVRIDQRTPPGTDRRLLYQTVLEWLPKIQDPLSLTMCLSRLGEPEARNLVKKSREMLFCLTREWNDRLREDDPEHTLWSLSLRVMEAALERDLPEVIAWAKDPLLRSATRTGYVFGLQRFARKPGIARDALLDFVNDRRIGYAAVEALAGALKADALPVLHKLRKSSPHDSVRDAANMAAKKIEARLRRVDLPRANPSDLPDGYISTTIEFDTDRVPQLLSILERELDGRLKPQMADQLALSANQIKRGRGRFHIVPITLSNGIETRLGLGFYAEDDDATVMGIYFEVKLRNAVEAAIACFLSDA